MRISEPAAGDGAPGFWKAVAKCWPQANQQRCRVHKTANVMEKLPKAMQPKVKEALYSIWQAETREQAYAAFDNCIERFSPEYPKAMAFKLMEVAQKKWFRLRGYKLLADVLQGIKSVNGVAQNGGQKQEAA